MSNSEKILKSLSSLIENGILTSNDIKKEIYNIKNIKDALSGKNVIKSIYVPNKILNIVIKA